MSTATKTIEHPILFSGPMVKAILDGSKTQTRRVVRFPSWFDEGGIPEQFDGYADCRPVVSRDILRHITNRHGWPGDRLWVRETWRFYGRNCVEGFGGGVQYRCDLEHRIFTEFEDPDAVYELARKSFESNASNRCNNWRPSIHMPRWASRITLEVTDVRVERLRDIGLQDIGEEGLDCKYSTPLSVHNAAKYRFDFAKLWDSINTKPDLSWDENPWVWVITFRRLEAT